MNAVRPASKKGPRLAFRLVALVTQLVLGAAAAVVALAACDALFGPFSDLGSLQLAAGPASTQAEESRPGVLPGRSRRG